MRLRIALFLALLLVPFGAHADLLKLMNGRGLVVMGYDDVGFSRDRQAASLSKVYDGQKSLAANFVYGSNGNVRFSLLIAKLDPSKKALGSISNRYSLLHSQALYTNTHFMYAEVPEGDYVIYKYVYDGRWGSCLNKKTVYFHVDAGSYNYLGKYSPFANQLQILKAIDIGAMPDGLVNGAEANIRDEALAGFTPNVEDIETKTAIEAEIRQLSPELAGPEFKLQTLDILSSEWDIDNGKAQGKGKCNW